MSYEKAKIKWVKENVKELEYKLSSHLYPCNYKIVEYKNPFGYGIFADPNGAVLRKAATINETGEIYLHRSNVSEVHIFKEWEHTLNDYISSLKNEHKNDNDSSLRKAKINIDIDDSKLKKIMDDVDYMSNKLLQIKGFYKDDFKRIRDEHLLAADDSAPVFKSPDDMLMYEASLLQDKIKHGEYKNHDQLMELHKAIMEINRLMKSPKLNDINFKPMTNKEMTKFVGDAIDENVKNLMQDL